MKIFHLFVNAAQSAIQSENKSIRQHRTNKFRGNYLVLVLGFGCLQMSLTIFSIGRYLYIGKISILIDIQIMY